MLHLASDARVALAFKVTRIQPAHAREAHNDKGNEQDEQDNENGAITVGAHDVAIALLITHHGEFLLMVVQMDEPLYHRFARECKKEAFADDREFNTLIPIKANRGFIFSSIS